MTPLLELTGVVVRRGGRTVLDLSALALEPGEILAILGPTGAGKSTLLRVAHLLEKPAAGTVRWRGDAVTWPPPLALRRRIAMAFQDPLPLSGSVHDNVAYGLAVRGERGAARDARVREALALFHIEHLRGQRATTLSGGEAQRTALARALVVRPELLLLDEPLAALDVPIREHLAGELRDAVRRYGTTCAYVTHDQSEAFAIADRVAILDAGRLLQVGTAEDVFYRPASREVAVFVRTGNILEAELRDDGAIEIGGRTLLAAQTPLARGPVLLCVRPEELRLERADGPPPGVAAPPVANRLAATVTGILDQGATLRITVDAGFPLVALITRRRAHELALAPGVAVRVEFRPSAAHLVSRRS